MNKTVIALIALGRYLNFPVRLLHPLLENIDGIKPYSIFFKDWQTLHFSPVTNQEEKLFIELITELNPKIVAFSVLSPYASIARRLTKLIKNNRPSTLVIWGGIHPTVCPEACIEEVDMVCIGEGEGAITDLANCVKGNKSYRFIKNLWVREGKNITKNPLRPLIRDLDSIPFPLYNSDSFYFINRNRMTKRDTALIHDFFFVKASRGCPYSCSFCVNGILKQLGHYIRIRTVGNVIAEIKKILSLAEGKMKEIMFADEIFASEEKWLDEFYSHYKKEIGLPIIVEYNPNFINLNLIDKLAKIGCKRINLGIQSGSDYIRNQIFNRPGKNSGIIDIANYATNRGVGISYDLILNNPYENEHILETTIQLLLQLPKPLFFNLFSLQFFPAYRLTEKAIKDKHIRPEDVNDDNLLRTIQKGWTFVPRLFPYTKKQILQNIIWLVAWNHVSNGIVKYSVFGNSLGSKLCLRYLNFKAIVLGKICGVGGIMERFSWVSYYSKRFGHYILRGDIKTLYFKIEKKYCRR